MSWAHVHLALNHVPVIGLPIVVLLLLWGLGRRNAEVIRAAFGLLVLLALVTLVVQLTGEPAEELVEGLPGVVDSIVERHEEAALVATVGMSGLGLLALFGWLRFRGGRMLPRWFPPVVLIGGVLLSGYFGWVANLGGQIRHSEIRPGQAAALSAGERAVEPGEEED
jgi:hypothetical protein